MESVESLMPHAEPHRLHRKPLRASASSAFSRRIFLFIAASVGVLLSAFVPALCAQSGNPKLPTDAEWNRRHELLQILLQQNGLRASTDIQETLTNPQGSAIVVLGRAELVAQEIALFQKFIQQGGRVLIAVNSMRIPSLGTIDPGPAHAERSADEFEHFSDCIILRTLSSQSPLTQNLNSIVTNVTGWIPSSSNNYRWEAILNLPNRTLPLDSRAKPVCLLGTLPEQDPTDPTAGGVILLADPSIISNGMLWYHDNGHFSARLANWLASGHRSNYTLINNGISSEDYPIEALMSPEEKAAMEKAASQPPPPKPSDAPTPPMDTLLALANSAIQEMADPARINRQLQNQPRQFRPTQYARSIFAALALAALCFLAWILLRRSTEYLNRKTPPAPTTPYEIQSQSLPDHLKNKIAAETLAKEFSKRWTGMPNESEWRRALEELKHIPESRLPAKERVQAESILAIAIFGGRSTMTNKDLVDVSHWIRLLLMRYPKIFQAT